MITVVMYVIVVMVFIILILGMILFYRWRYNKQIEGKLWCEFWPENKQRYRLLLPKNPDGCTIDAPQGHDVRDLKGKQYNRYVYSKGDIDIAKYPPNPFLGIKALQVDCPLVSWKENYPDPINPYRDEPIVTASKLANLNEDAFLAFAMAASQHIAELEKELAAALASKVNRNIVYVGLAILLVANIIVGFLVYKVSSSVDALKALWGI